MLRGLLAGISQALSSGGHGTGWRRVVGHVSARGYVLGRVEDAKALLLDSFKAVIDLG